MVRPRDKVPLEIDVIRKRAVEVEGLDEVEATGVKKKVKGSVERIGEQQIANAMNVGTIEGSE